MIQSRREKDDIVPDLRRIFHKPQTGLGGVLRLLSLDLDFYTKKLKLTSQQDAASSSENPGIDRQIGTELEHRFESINRLLESANQSLKKRAAGCSLGTEERATIKKAMKVLKIFREKGYKNSTSEMESMVQARSVVAWLMGSYS